MLGAGERMGTVLRIVCFGIALVLAGAVRAEIGPPPDRNKDGKADVENILEKAEWLQHEGVIFDENDPGGHIPVRRKDGKFHMVCVDLLTVTYRAAGYKVPSTRLVTQLIGHVKKSKDFQWYEGPGQNLYRTTWRPETPFRVGDMIFVHYSDNKDRHSGLVTGVDPTTGLPSHITQISVYSENEGMCRSTFDGFFSLRCRMLTGWARPRAWDVSEPSDRELELTVKPSPAPAAPLPKFPVHGDSAQQMHSLLNRVRTSRDRTSAPPPAAAPESEHGAAAAAPHANGGTSHHAPAARHQ
jgi:hypothetical protein